MEFNASNGEYSKQWIINVDIKVGHLKPFYSKKEQIFVPVEQF